MIDDSRFHEIAGILAEIPGVQRSIDQLQRYKEQLQARVEELRSEGQHGGKRQGAGRPTTKKRADNISVKTGRPVTDPFWAHMSAKERSEEMRRRQAKGRAKQLANEQAEAPKLRPGQTTNHPRNPDHPGHAAWIEKMTAIQKARYAALSPRQRKEQAAKMLAGRQAQMARVNGQAGAQP